ncbi:MAG: hypothetical protein ACK5LK_05030 [Chthoniobacterales bacterium]
MLTAAIHEVRNAEADREVWSKKLSDRTTFESESSNIAKLTPAVNTEAVAANLGVRKDEVNPKNVTAINEVVRNYAAKNNLDMSTADGYDAAHIGAAQANPELFNS